VLLGLTACASTPAGDDAAMTEPQELARARLGSAEPDRGARAPGPDALGTTPTCPTIDPARVDELEPPSVPPDTRFLPLSELLRVAEVRVPGLKTKKYDLGHFGMFARSPAPLGDNSTGMGWQVLDPERVRPGISPEALAEFDAWRDAREHLFDTQRASYLIGQRKRYLETVTTGPTSWGGWVCTSRAAAQLEETLHGARAAAQRTREALRSTLEAVSNASAEERLLLAVLVADQPGDPRDPDAQDRPRRMFEAIARDDTVDVEVRARAWMQLARITPDVRGTAFTEALRRARRLSKDPEVEVSVRLKLAQVEPDPTRKMERLRDLLPLLKGPNERWRVAMVSGQLAEMALEHRDYAAAVRHGARCATVSVETFEHDDDPWGCAPAMAEAIVELGADAVAADLELPHRFVGPLALSLMQASLGVRDYGQARHVGEAALRLVPEAAEAPEILMLLAGLTDDAGTRAELIDRKVRDYSPEGTWWRTQRERMAWGNIPERVSQLLDDLAEPPRLTKVERPTDAAALQDELRNRASAAFQACEETLGSDYRRFRLTVNTEGSTPKVEVRGATREQKACIRQAARARFWSIGPAKVTLSFEFRP